MSVRLDVDLQITPFFKNKHFELCCFVMYRVRNIVNRRESDVICHSVEGHGHPLVLIVSTSTQFPK
jgi:hypothetical protein